MKMYLPCATKRFISSFRMYSFFCQKSVYTFHPSACPINERMGQNTEDRIQAQLQMLNIYRVCNKRHQQGSSPDQSIDARVNATKYCTLILHNLFNLHIHTNCSFTQFTTNVIFLTATKRFSGIHLCF